MNQTNNNLQSAQVDFHIFLFINSGSGSGIGQDLVKFQGPINFQIIIPKTQPNSHKLRHEQIVRTYFFNLRTQRDEGFNLLKKSVEQNKKCLGVICGGDGTVTWIISEMDKYKIPSIKVPFSIIPLGTGNDFSQSLGWGPTTTDLFSNQNYRLKKFFMKMLIAQQEQMDVWQVTAQTYDYGKIQKFEQKQDKDIGKSITKCFINYFSFGLDGKVGYSFDKHRTKSRIGNLAVYGALGMVKGMTKTKNLNDLLNYFKQQSKYVQNGKISLNTNDYHDIVFQSTQKGKKSEYVYEQNQNILALNINSFMGGCKDIWKNSTSTNKSTPLPQSSSDGKIQFVSFPGSVSIGMQKTLGGFAHRVHQGSGPFTFDFKKYEPQIKHRTYLQIDGEFLRFTHPKKVVLQKSALLGGKFSVLRCNYRKHKSSSCCGGIF